MTVRNGDGQEIKAMVYVMTKGHEAPARPSIGYFSGIVEGFQQNGMDTRPLAEALEQLGINSAGKRVNTA